MRTSLVIVGTVLLALVVTAYLSPGLAGATEPAPGELGVELALPPNTQVTVTVKAKTTVDTNQTRGQDPPSTLTVDSKYVNRTLIKAMWSNSAPLLQFAMTGPAEGAVTQQYGSATFMTGPNDADGTGPKIRVWCWNKEVWPAQGTEGEISVAVATSPANSRKIVAEGHPDPGPYDPSNLNPPDFDWDDTIIEFTWQ